MMNNRFLFRRPSSSALKVYSRVRVFGKTKEYGRSFAAELNQVNGIRKQSTYNKLSIAGAFEQLKRQEISVQHLVETCCNRATVGDEQRHLGVYAERSTPSELQRRIEESQKRYDDGRPKSKLDGIPVAIKSNIAVKGFSLNAGSNILGSEIEEASRAFGYNADVTNRLLEDAGAILIGTTRLDEFGMGSLGIHNNYPSSNSVTHNPIHYSGAGEDTDALSSNYRLAAGGSSSGSAVAVAHNSALLALGTDTGGSVRLPASWCPDVTGYKPTYGSISRYGVVSYASSLDTVGLLAATPDDIEIAQELLINRENGVCRDGTACYVSSQYRHSNNSSPESTSLEGVRVGIPEAFCIDACPSHVSEAWERASAALEECGAEVIIVSRNILKPSTVQASLSSYYVLACSEASSNLARYDGVRFGPTVLDLVKQHIRDEEDHSTISQHLLNASFESQISAFRALGFGSEVIKRIIAGTAVLSSDRFHTHYQAAAKQRTILKKEFEEAFQNHVDAMIVPTAVTLPPWIQIQLHNDEEHNLQPDGSDLLSNDVMTTPISLAGLPAVSIPVPMEEQSAPLLTSPDKLVSVSPCSIGMQIFGPPMSDASVINISKSLHSQLHKRA